MINMDHHILGVSAYRPMHDICTVTVYVPLLSISQTRRVPWSPFGRGLNKAAWGDLWDTPAQLIRIQEGPNRLEKLRCPYYEIPSRGSTKNFEYERVFPQPQVIRSRYARDRRTSLSG